MDSLYYPYNCNGIIMIITCNKFIGLRSKYKLQKLEYNNYHVIYVVGNLNINEYTLENNLLTIKCEDSYIHLLKKVSLAMKILMSIYNIKEGILRCGDDLLFDENNLIQFLTSVNKSHYMGTECSTNTYKKTKNNWMIDYYKKHKLELLHPLHGLNNIDINVYNNTIGIKYCVGTIIYFSKLACQIIINHMEIISYNVFFHNKQYDTYPYFIEDVGLGYIMSVNNIFITPFDINNICLHTNDHREIIDGIIIFIKKTYYYGNNNTFTKIIFDNIGNYILNNDLIKKDPCFGIQKYLKDEGGNILAYEGDMLIITEHCNNII